MDTELYYAFIDESGNPSIETHKEGVSSHFIITAIIIARSRKDLLEENVNAVRAKYFQTGEMKSSQIGSDHKRRRAILSNIAQLDFHFYSIIIEKEAVYKNSGLIYKRPFIKYVHRLLLNKLNRAFSDVHVIADEHGHPQFMESFKKYVDKKFSGQLFNGISRFDFADSRNQPLIQLADFLSGTLAKEYDLSITESFDTRKILREQTLGRDEWPEFWRSVKALSINNHDNEFDNFIRELSLKQAANFINDNLNSKNEEIINQVEALKHLVYCHMYIDPEAYVPTHGIKEAIWGSRTDKVSIQVFRSKVIAKLRDEGVIIASSHLKEGGYKIPHTYSDIIDYVDHVNSVIVPMIKRLGKARELMKMASTNQIDLLDSPKYDCLKKFFQNK